MTTSTTRTLAQTPFGFDSTAAEVIDGIDPLRQARDLNGAFDRAENQWPTLLAGRWPSKK